MSRIISANVQPQFVQHPEDYALLDGIAGAPPQWLKLWPTRPYLLPGDWGSPLMPDAPDYWLWDPPTPGSSTQKAIVGTTVDSTGSALGNCTVTVVRQSDGATVQTLTSDANGHFEAYVPDTGNYQVIGVLAGSPDRAGASDNNLAGV